MNEKMYYCNWPSFEETCNERPHRPTWTCECNCNCWEQEPCHHHKPHCPCPKDCDDDINLYVRNDCRPQPQNPCCCPDFARYLCTFIGQKVLITMGGRRGKVVILEVTGCVVKCLVIGNGKIVYLNIDRIDSITPLCC